MDNQDKPAQRSSFMYSMLSTTLHIPPFMSLRRTISDYNVRWHRRASTQLVHRPAESDHVDANHERNLLGNSCDSERVDTGKKYAIQGSHLLNTALAESDLPDPQSQAFSRQLYVNSMTYLLQGLPDDLTEQEIEHLRAALPESLNCPDCTGITACHQQQPSMLHRGIATLIVSLCVLIRLVLPYIKYFLAIAYSYERTHHVTEKALAISMNTVDSVGSKSTTLARSAMDNKLVMGSLLYCIEGICGGLNEGIGEGMKAIEARDKP